MAMSPSIHIVVSVVDEQRRNESLDELADLFEHWKRHRSQGRTPAAIRCALLKVIGEVARVPAEPAPATMRPLGEAWAALGELAQRLQEERDIQVASARFEWLATPTMSNPGAAIVRSVRVDAVSTRVEG